MDVSWGIKKGEHWKIDAFELWGWRRLLRVPWAARRSNQSILKENSPEYSLEGLMLKLKFQYFGYLRQRANSVEKFWCWERLRAGGEGSNREFLLIRALILLDKGTSRIRMPSPAGDQKTCTLTFFLPSFSESVWRSLLVLTGLVVKYGNNRDVKGTS